MEKLINAHSVYDNVLGTFPTKRAAENAAAELRTELPRLNYHLNHPKFVAISGRGGRYYVEFPRIHYTWMPLDRDADNIKAELTIVVKMFEEVL